MSLLYSLLLLAGIASALDASSCTCGFYDEAQDNLWTDSLIVYFNETTTVPENSFVREDYQQKWQQGWNALYLPGASVNNSWVGNSSSKTGQNALQLFLSPADPSTHHTVGASIRSRRQDMQYGSFRAYMKGPKEFAGGSSLSMTLEYNLTQQLTLNMMNTASRDTAWISTLVNHEFSDRYLGVNYTNISNPDFGANPLADPYAYNDMRIDWTPYLVNYWLGKNLSRSITHQANDNSDRPSVPMPLRFRHWSDGDEYAMDGPPLHNESETNVLFVRAFFNTTSMNSSAMEDFNGRCSKSTACSTEQMDLRGSTAYQPESEDPWRQADDLYTIRWPAIAIMALSLLLSVSTLSNVAFRRIILPSEEKAKESTSASQTDESQASTDHMSFTSGGTTPLAMHTSPYASGYVTPVTSGSRTIRNISSASTLATYLTGSQASRPPSIREQNGKQLSVPRLPFDGPSGTGNASASSSKSSLDRINEADSDVASPSPISSPSTPFSPFAETRNISFLGAPPDMPTFAPAVIGDTANEEVIRNGVIAENVKGKAVPISSSAAPTKDSTSGGAPAPRQRVDYLAGLLAVCSTVVSMTHFALTFIPATIMPTSDAHYESENWARKTIGWFWFNEIWVVLFFTTSSRFLTTKYLREGKLDVIAEKTTSRTFRLMIPIIGVILLEYFLMDVGALDWLQFLSSITWSTWPYTIVYKNFGSFVSETLELIYTVPNAQPQITFNYCTGVLWTIPVQLDGSWQALMSVMVFYEIKNAYKRFGYYFIVILTHWYARSWGGLFVAGLCMADLDVTYKYKKKLYANPWVYYPLLNLVILLILTSLANELIQVWTGFNWQTFEAGWHIDIPTGLSMLQAGTDVYPPYYVPKLASLTFAVGAQLLVEWSAVVQKCISIKIVLILFPHIFTIYLFHGFIFWSVGAAACVGLSAAGLPYWANMLLTFIISYSAMYLSLPIITPVVEALGKSVTMSIWASASEQPAPKRHTTFPFPQDLFTSRNVESPLDPSMISSRASSLKEESKVSTNAVDSSASSLNEKAIPPGERPPENKWPLVNEKPVPF